MNYDDDSIQVRGDRNALVNELATVDFDYDKIFTDLDGHMAEAVRDVELEKLAESYRQCLHWVLITSKGSRRKMRHAFKRFVCLVALLHPEMFDNKSYAQIGRELGIGKAGVSWIAKELQERHRIKFARMRSETACRNMAAGQLKSSKP